MRDTLDEDVVAGLRRVAAGQAAATSPWPGVDRAVRRQGRRRGAAITGLAAGLVAVVALALPVLSGMGDQTTGTGPGPVSTGRPAPATTMLPNPPPPTGLVADYFDPGVDYPGPGWSRGGVQVDPEELNTIRGPEHCDWQSAVFLHLGWPLGTVSQTALDVRQFVRDPEGAIDPRYAAALRIGITLPGDAVDTGYGWDGLRLYLAAGDPDGIYLAGPADTERWPRTSPYVGCD